MREAIAQYRERGSSVYVCALDVAKAFDSIWINGWLYMLYEEHIDGKLWRLLVQMYRSFQCCVSIGAKLSSTFTAHQGLHQGAPISMIGFNLYSNKLIADLKNCQVGLHIGGIKVTSPAYGDDLTIMATSVAAMSSENTNFGKNN